MPAGLGPWVRDRLDRSQQTGSWGVMFTYSLSPDPTGLTRCPRAVCVTAEKPSVSREAAGPPAQPLLQRKMLSHLLGSAQREALCLSVKPVSQTFSKRQLGQSCQRSSQDSGFSVGLNVLLLLHSMTVVTTARCPPPTVLKGERAFRPHHGPRSYTVLDI